MLLYRSTPLLLLSVYFVPILTAKNNKFHQVNILLTIEEVVAEKMMVLKHNSIVPCLQTIIGYSSIYCGL